MVTGGSGQSRVLCVMSWGLQIHINYAKLSLQIMCQQEGCCTFDKHLCETLVLADHTLIRSIISQARLVDGKRSQVPVCLNDIPWKMTNRSKVPFIKLLEWFGASLLKKIIQKNKFYSYWSHFERFLSNTSSICISVFICIPDFSHIQT